MNDKYLLKLADDMGMLWIPQERFFALIIHISRLSGKIDFGVCRPMSTIIAHSTIDTLTDVTDAQRAYYHQLVAEVA